jgi:hypothetical protein
LDVIPISLEPSSIRFETGSKLREIKARAFCTCSQRESLSLPPSLEHIGEHLFDSQYDPAGPSVQTLTFEPGSKLSRIDGHAFSNCLNLKSICLSASLRQLDATAFIDTGITAIEIELGNPYFSVGGGFVIRQKSSRSLVRYFGTSPDVLVDNTIDIIGKSCFESCCSIRMVGFAPQSRVRVIRGRAFADCRALRSISIPSSVEYLHKDCFHSCTSLSAVSFPSGAKFRKLPRGAFMNCPSLRSIIIPSSVEVIAGACFDGCKSMASVTFESPSNLKRIESTAFAGCEQLTSFVLPSSVEILGRMCFPCCLLLTNFTILEPSHLVACLSLPPCLSGTFAVPDSVEGLEYGACAESRPPLVLTFGRESKLCWVDKGYPDVFHYQPDQLQAVFVHLTTASLKRVRSNLEYPFGARDPKLRYPSSPWPVNRESDVSSDEA